MIMKSSPVKSLLIFFGTLIVLGIVFSTLNLNGSAKPASIDLGALAHQITAGEVKSVTVKDSTMSVVTNDKKDEVASKEGNESFTAVMKNLGVSDDKLAAIDLKVENASAFSNWMSVMLPIILPILAIGILVLFMMRSVQGQNSRAMSFGQSGAREYGKNDKNRLTFGDA